MKVFPHTVLKKILMVLSMVLFFSCPSCSADSSKSPTHPVVKMQTNYGDVTIELYPDKAPETVANFLKYVDEGFYNHTIFHRVIDGFMIQGGGFDPDLSQKKTKAAIRNEADNRLPNKKGSIAMARTSEIHSATAQFFINLADNDFLNFKSPSPSSYGYCVFGQVVAGMDVVNKIGKAATGMKKGMQDVPVETAEIIEIVRVNK